MAILHKATLTPTKKEVAAAWLPQQDWFEGDVAGLVPVATFRLDDPAGEVGIESIVLATADGEWYVPMTYRAEPLDGGAEHLIGVMEHSVLGTRYVYDATGDPVFLEAVRTTIRDRGHEADLVRARADGTSETVEKTMTARGTGGEGVDVVIERTPRPATDADLVDGSGALVAERTDHDPVVLARLL